MGVLLWVALGASILLNVFATFLIFRADKRYWNQIDTINRLNGQIIRRDMETRRNGSDILSK